MRFFSTQKQNKLLASDMNAIEGSCIDADFSR